MPYRRLATELFGALARALARSNELRASDPQSAEITGKRSVPPDECAKALEPNFGDLLHLFSLGIVALPTVIVFFGIGFLLLAHPNEQLIAGPDVGDRGVESAPRPPDLAPSPDKVGALSTTQTASASSVPPAQISEHSDVLPLASKERAVGSAPATDTAAVNAIPDAAASANRPALRSNTAEATVATPAGNANAKGTGIGRHSHVGTRKDWARISRPEANRPPPPAVSGPERAWHWIVQSATGILAALSPPPPRPGRGLETHWRAD